MLYNPKWQQPPATTLPTLDGFIAWLEMMPPDGAYNFECTDGRCLVALYGCSLSSEWNHSRDYMSFCRRIFGGKGYNVGPACMTPWTFGAALERAREFQKAA